MVNVISILNENVWNVPLGTSVKKSKRNTNFLQRYGKCQVINILIYFNYTCNQALPRADCNWQAEPSIKKGINIGTAPANTGNYYK